jgi:hypothetical protein
MMEGLTHSFGSSFHGGREILTEHLQACRLPSLANLMAAVIGFGEARIHPGTMTRKEKLPHEERLSCSPTQHQISRITGMIKGRRLVLFWIYRFRSVRIFSLITP